MEAEILPSNSKDNSQINHIQYYGPVLDAYRPFSLALSALLYRPTSTLVISDAIISREISLFVALYCSQMFESYGERFRWQYGG